MAAPYEVNGRFRGGIHMVACEILDNCEIFTKNGYEIRKFETCRIQRNSRDNSLNLSNFINSFKIIKDLPHSIKNENGDILYFHTSIGFALIKDLIAVRRAKKKTRISTIIHIHYAEYEKIVTGIALLDKLIIRLMRKYVDNVVFLSEVTKSEFVKRGLKEEKCSVIYNFSTLRMSKEEFDHKRETENEKKKLLFVGSIDQRKGLFETLRCLERIKEPFEVHVCGKAWNEEDQQAFDRYIDKSNLDIKYHGYVEGENKRRIFIDSDLLFLPSLEEGLPIVIMEALSTGCVVLTTKVGAIPEIITEKNGYIITSGSEDELNNAIKDFFSLSRSEIINLQSENYRYSTEFSIDNFLCKMLMVCEKV